MTKNEFVSMVAKRSGSKKKYAEPIIDAVFESISELMEEGEQLKVNGFGIFEVKARAEYNGHNPLNGKSIVVPATVTPVFRPSQLLKNRVNEKSKGRKNNAVGGQIET